MPLTALGIQKLKPASALYRKADSGGLCIEATPNGSKLWRWKYRFNGKAQMLALGKWPDGTARFPADRCVLHYRNHHPGRGAGSRKRMDEDGTIRVKQVISQTFR